MGAGEGEIHPPPTGGNLDVVRNPANYRLTAAGRRALGSIRRSGVQLEPDGLAVGRLVLARVAHVVLHIPCAPGFAVLAGERFFGDDGEIGGVGFVPDAMQQHVHRAEAGDAVDQLDAVEGAIFQGLLLGAVETGEFREVVEGGEEEAAGGFEKLDRKSVV